MKIAIITGASSGMGREFALQIDKKYGKLDELWLIARREDRLKAVANECHIKTRIFPIDLTNPADISAFANILGDETLEIDIKLLVNAAGFGLIGRFDELDITEQCNMIDLNCKALTLFTGVCLPYISGHSRIINLASAAGFAPQPNFNVYAATKAYVLNYSRALNVELKPQKISVTAVCPGPVDTEFFDRAGEYNSSKGQKANPAKVVAKAIKDAALGYDISIYGATMKSAHIASKLVPDKIIMNFFK